MNWSVITLGFAFIFAVVGSVLDNWTTYIALTEFGYAAREANPLAAAGFRMIGLEAGLVVNLCISIGAMIFIAQTQRVQRNLTRVLLLGFLGTIRGLAALNNWVGILALGA